MCANCAAAGDGPAVSFVDLRSVAASCGWQNPAVKSNAVVLSSPRGTMEFGRDSRKVICNDILLWLNVPARGEGPDLQVCRQDVDDIIRPLLASGEVPGATHGRVVALDPGHGGEDGGAVGPRGTIEKYLVLDIAKRVKTRLQASGVTVQMTRTKDRAVSLSARTEKAAEWKADLFVSIHINYAGDSGACGFESFVMAAPGQPSTAGGTSDTGVHAGNGHAPADSLLGYYVQRGVLCYAGGADRGVKRARFQVLREAGCPSALVECGFLSNSKDESNLRSAAFRSKVADGIASGILTYLSKVAATAPVPTAVAPGY